MKKTTALWTFALLVSFRPAPLRASLANRSGRSVNLTLADRMEAPPQAAKAPHGKAGKSMTLSTPWPRRKTRTRRLPWQRLSSRNTRTQTLKLGLSDEMQAYQQLNQTDKAVDVAEKHLRPIPTTFRHSAS